MSAETDGRAHEYDLVVRGERVLVASGEQPREVGVVGGVVRAIEPLGAGLDGARVVELAPHQVLVPGLVDTHVHVNEPGRTEWGASRPRRGPGAPGGCRPSADGRPTRSRPRWP